MLHMRPTVHGMVSLSKMPKGWNTQSVIMDIEWC